MLASLFSRYSVQIEYLERMAPFRWPSIRHDLALAKEVASTAPEKPAEWDTLAAKLSEAFSTDAKVVEVKGRGCRERIERLIDKYKKEDAKALKRCKVRVHLLYISSLLVIVVARLYVYPITDTNICRINTEHSFLAT